MVEVLGRIAERIATRNSKEIYNEVLRYRADVFDILEKYVDIHQEEKPSTPLAKQELYKRMLGEICETINNHGGNIDAGAISKRMPPGFSFPPKKSIATILMNPFFSYWYDYPLIQLSVPTVRSLGQKDIIPDKLANYFDRVRYIFNLLGLKKRVVLMPASGIDISCAVPPNVNRLIIVDKDKIDNTIGEDIENFQKHGIILPDENVEGIAAKVELVQGDANDEKTKKAYENKGINVVFLKGFLRDVLADATEGGKEMIAHYANILPDDGIFVLAGKEAESGQLHGWLKENNFVEDERVAEHIGRLRDHNGMKLTVRPSSLVFPEENFKVFKRVMV